MKDAGPVIARLRKYRHVIHMSVLPSFAQTIKVRGNELNLDELTIFFPETDVQLFESRLCRLIHAVDP